MGGWRRWWGSRGSCWVGSNRPAAARQRRCLPTSPPNLPNPSPRSATRHPAPVGRCRSASAVDRPRTPDPMDAAPAREPSDPVEGFDPKVALLEFDQWIVSDGGVVPVEGVQVGDWVVREEPRVGRAGGGLPGFGGVFGGEGECVDGVWDVGAAGGGAGRWWWAAGRGRCREWWRSRRGRWGL